MALNYSILQNKGKLYKNYEDGSSEEFIDLLTPTTQYLDINNADLIMVNEYYVARPDLISLAVYGDDKYADIICKLNGISNPFELNENDLIYVPTMWQLEQMLLSKQRASEIVNDNTKLISRQRKLPTQKEKNEKRSPSEQVIGDTNYIVDKSLGVVFY